MHSHLAILSSTSSCHVISPVYISIIHVFNHIYEMTYTLEDTFILCTNSAAELLVSLLDSV